MVEQLKSEMITLERLAKTFDHSLLKPEITEIEVIAGCELSKRYHVGSVCVKPCYVRVAARVLAGSDVAVGTVVAFPHGDSTTDVKIFEARDAIANGAVELDMVMNIGELRSGHTDFVREDIKAVVDVAGGKAIVKVILENKFLTDEQKVLACKLAEEAGADFVKTSTGWGPPGSEAQIADVKLMRKSVGPQVQVKAAYGIRTLDKVFAMIDAGVTRIGLTGTERLLEEFKKRRGA